MKCEIVNIEQKLCEIFKNRAGIDFNTNEKLKGEKLFGNKVNMPVRELVLVFDDIERVFSININKEYVLSGRFDSFVNIQACVLESIE